AEGGHESTASTTRFSGCYSGEGSSLGSGVGTTGVACYCTGTNWGVTGVVSLGTGTGATSGPCSGSDGSSTTTIGIGSGSGHTGR
ncbi:hypothetical protein KI387_012951, partial [Taxus chinensis]